MLTLQRRTIIIITTLLLLLVVGGVVFVSRRPVPFEATLPGEVTIPGEPTEGSLPFDASMASTYRNTTSSGATVPSTSPTPSSKSQRLSYGEVVKEFDALGRRIQLSFSQQNVCQARPSRLVAKQNAVLMLDNRSERTITIILDGASYRIPAFRYHLAKFPFSGGVGEYRLHCDKQFNVATVLVQP